MIFFIWLDFILNINIDISVSTSGQTHSGSPIQHAKMRITCVISKFLTILAVNLTTMAIFKTPDRYVKPAAVVSSTIFACLAALHFIPCGELRKPHPSDGFLCSDTHHADMVFCRKIPHQGGARRQADRKSKGIYLCHLLLVRSPRRTCLHSHRQKHSGRNDKNRNGRIYIYDKRHARVGSSAKKFIIRTGGRPLRLFRFHTWLGHIHGTCRKLKMAHNASLLSGTMADIYKINLIPGSTRNEVDEILICIP